MKDNGVDYVIRRWVAALPMFPRMFNRIKNFEEL